VLIFRLPLGPWCHILAHDMMAVHCRAANLQQHGRGKRTTSNDGIHNLTSPERLRLGHGHTPTPGPWCSVLGPVPIPVSIPGPGPAPWSLVLGPWQVSCHTTHSAGLSISQLGVAGSREHDLSPSGRH